MNVDKQAWEEFNKTKQEEFMIPDDDTAEEVRKLRRVVTFQTFIVSVLMIVQLYVFWPVH